MDSFATKSQLIVPKLILVKSSEIKEGESEELVKHS